MDTCADSRIIIMSIAALLKAAEYIDRRDRGELDFLCLNCQSSAVRNAHVNMAPVYFCRGAISWFWRNGSVACCRSWARVRVQFTGLRRAQERRKATEDQEVSGQQVSDRPITVPVSEVNVGITTLKRDSAADMYKMYVFCSRTTHNELEKNRWDRLE